MTRPCVGGCCTKYSWMCAICCLCVSNRDCTTVRETEKKGSAMVPLFPSFISIAIPTITAEVIAISVNTAATWRAGELHLHYVDLLNSVNNSLVSVTHKHTGRHKQTKQQPADRPAEKYVLKAELQVVWILLTIMCLSGSGSEQKWLWCVCVCVCLGMCSADTLMLLL